MVKIRQFSIWFKHHRLRVFKIGGILLFLSLIVFLTVQAYQLFSYLKVIDEPRNQSFFQWATGSHQEKEGLITTSTEVCPDAPFMLPADGFIGLLYEDPRAPYSFRNPHQGIDIFSNTEAGIIPVYAAYDGYITREASWKSSLILRVPNDPLRSGKQIWLYYTHMADREGNDFINEMFPPGTEDLFVEKGTLLGYTGDYNGNSPRDIWVHLHFSIVEDDGNGRYQNELEFKNTLDPSPYLGLSVNYACESQDHPTCALIPACRST